MNVCLRKVVHEESAGFFDPQEIFLYQAAGKIRESRGFEARNGSHDGLGPSEIEGTARAGRGVFLERVPTVGAWEHPKILRDLAAGPKFKLFAMALATDFHWQGPLDWRKYLHAAFCR